MQFLRSAMGRGRESRWQSRARKSDRRGRDSASVLVSRWVEIRGLACSAWPRISGHPSDGPACLPGIAVDFLRRLQSRFVAPASRNPRPGRQGTFVANRSSFRETAQRRRIRIERQKRRATSSKGRGWGWLFKFPGTRPSRRESASDPVGSWVAIRTQPCVG